ncbi:hypothetical protein NLG97_g1352 [Lecanicillium saksenae]|uniref:Uncharacterized protein n=1 Tax=Lecanicillium saksenae TaxID=468837 RepID=A0ACC1R3Z7_9HYPO|nr:hypothetical protein NLG97_g1352 [Lecanicillium saksenae]
MHLLSAYISVAVLGHLSAAAPFGLHSGLISQDPKNYAPNFASRLFGAGRGSSPDPDPDDADDDDDDDDEDLIPGDLLEGDNDSGGESDIGNDAVSVANGLLGGGAGSAALNNKTSGSTAVFCSLFACASAAQSDGKVSTSATGARIHASGPLISIKGPLVVIQASRKSVKKA